MIIVVGEFGEYEQRTEVICGLFNSIDEAKVAIRTSGVVRSRSHDYDRLYVYETNVGEWNKTRLVEEIDCRDVDARRKIMNAL